MDLQGYEFGAIIAQSATTIVRRATRRNDGTHVVIKTSSREYPTAREIGQLEFEYRVLRKLDAPGIVRALDLQKAHDRLVLVLEDFGGKSLAALRDPARVDAPLGPASPADRLPPASAGMELDVFFEIALALTRAVGYLHGRNVIHKDLNPSNVLFNATTRQVKIIDFGICSELSQEHQDAEPGSHLEGTLAYMSPEQTGRMNRDLDYRSDYYSLGVTFFELVTGSLPFAAEDNMGWVHCHISKPAPSARDVNPRLPVSLGRVIGKLLWKNPEDRYQSAHGLLRDLEICRSEWSGQAPAVFVPGGFDVPERFQVSQQLFGREEEYAELRRTFETASHGAAKLFLVAGHSGVGKSALIHQLQKDIVRERGYFIAGKFDQLEHNVPYAAVLQALRGLVKQILTEPASNLASWRQRLSGAVGASGKVLVDLVPELENVLGPQCAVPELAPREAQARLHRIFAEFLHAVARPEHPLVMFVDDLQWADASTPELLAHLVAELRHLLIIGAFRDNEVSYEHPLLLSIQSLREQRGDAVGKVSLLPLSAGSVNRIVADTLRCDPPASVALSDLIYQKTAGNPFFVKELLNLLARDHAFRFVAEEGRWDWDYDKISRAKLSDNVVDLMVERLQRLAPETVDALRLSACLGNQVDLGTLSELADRPADVLAKALWSAVEERVIVPIGTNYRLIHDSRENGASSLAADVKYQFQHDRVQQAAYALTDGPERARTHLRIGRMLRARSQGRADEGLFDIVNHLNLGRELITSAAERDELSRLNESAGKKARRAAAYGIAATYFDIGAALRTEQEWAAEPARLFANRRDQAECIFFLGEPDRASTFADDLIRSAPDKVCKVAALELKARVLDHQARLMEAIDTLRQALKLLGLELPHDPAEIDRQIGEGIGKMQAHLARTPIEELVRLPEMMDEEKITMMDLLFKLVVPSIQAYPPLFILSELLMFDLALTSGITATSCKNFIDCGIIQGPILGDYDRAYRLGKVAFELLKRDASKPLSSAVSFVFASFISSWRAHYRESLASFADAERWGLEYGDVQHTLYAHSLSTQRWFFAGLPLSDCDAKAARAASYLRQVRAVNQLDGVIFVQRAVAALRGASSDPSLTSESEDVFDARIQKSGNAQFLFMHGQSRAMVSFLLGDVDAAERWNSFAAKYQATGGNIHFSSADHLLFDSLVSASKWNTASAERRASLIEGMLANEAKLKKLADSCPANFAHKHKLVGAEIARLRGAPMEEVIGLYQEAIEVAQDDFVHLRALTNELLAEYFLTQGQPRIARTFLDEAYYLYERWGANAKLLKLRTRHRKTFERAPEVSPAASAAMSGSSGLLRTGFVPGDSLDLDSLIKATSAISSEVKADKLFAKLMATIIENAGAQRGCLILPQESTGDLFVEAVAHAHEKGPDRHERLALADCGELSADVVRYVARACTTVVVDDAVHHDEYRDDPYIERNGIQSILCMPVLGQGKLLAILYVENNTATHAFTPERIRLLEVLASQAAISMTNAQLYDNLEEKVAARTRELADKNREVAAMLNSMQQGIFTFEAGLAILPGYSAYLEQILGAFDLAGQDCLGVLFAGSNVGDDAIDLMRAALLVIFEMPADLGILNARHLVKEFQRRGRRDGTQHLEVDWNLIEGQDGQVKKVLVAVRDVTLFKQLKESVARNRRELDIVGQILDGGIEAFQGLAAAARAALHENTTVLREHGVLSREQVELLFRNMHTIKGNARLLGLAELVAAAHAAETAYDRMRSTDEVPPQEELVAGLRSVGNVLREYEEVHQRKLGELGRAVDRSPELALREIGTIVKAAIHEPLRADDAFVRIDRAIARAVAVPFREIVRECTRGLSSLARDLGKPMPEIEISGIAVRLGANWVRTMKDALVHAFSNSMDHGIEPARERESKGKGERGRISLRASKNAAGLTICMADDGRGLPLGALRAQLGKRDASDEEVAQAVFVSGVSTAGSVSTTSGRGVGMDAVRTFVQKSGGDVNIAFTAPSSDGYRRFELVFHLPEAAFFTDVRESASPPLLEPVPGTTS